jgi:hypothetical protein
MNSRIMEFIIWFLWGFFLFGMWVTWSLYKGTGGQWWSMFSLNPEKSGPWAMEFSFIKILISASLSLITAYFITKWVGKEKSN